MELKIHRDLKSLIENNPEIIDLIELHHIDELYYFFSEDNLRMGLEFQARNDIRRLLIALDIDPLKYITKLPVGYIYNDDIDSLIIPSNINRVSRRAIQFCDIDTLQIDAQTIDMSTYAIVDSNINTFICKSDIITTFGYVTTLIGNIGDERTEFVFKQGALIQDGITPSTSIEDVIRKYKLNDKFNIRLI